MQKSPKERESMAIGWLFFGTLAEVTGCYLDITNYLRPTEKGQFVLKMTETSMNALLERWFTIQTHFKGSKYVRGIPEPVHGIMMDNEAKIANKDNIQTLFDTLVRHGSMPMVRLNAEGKSSQFERAHSCLRKSKAIIGLLYKAIDTKTVFVIATLYQFLAEALTTVVFRGEVARAYDMLGEYSLGRWTAGADFCHFNEDAVRKLGWCPRTAQYFWSDGSRTMAVDYFATNLKSYQSSEDHSSCTEDVCSAYQLVPEKYEVVHAPEKGTKCKCPHLDLDPNSSSKILESGDGSFPLVTVSAPTESTSNDLDSGFSSLTLSHLTESETFVKAYDAASKGNYVAISHVWSHGLGNPRKNYYPSVNCNVSKSL
jgi:hypothetical protein